MLRLIPPTYRRPLVLNAGLLTTVGLLFGILYAMSRPDKMGVSAADGDVFMLLGLAFLVGVLLNGGLTIWALLKRRAGLAATYLLASGLWGLLLYGWVKVLLTLGNKIGG